MHGPIAHCDPLGGLESLFQESASLSSKTRIKGIEPRLGECYPLHLSDLREGYSNCDWFFTTFWLTNLTEEARRVGEEQYGEAIMLDFCSIRRSARPPVSVGLYSSTVEKEGYQKDNMPHDCCAEFFVGYGIPNKAKALWGTKAHSSSWPFRQRIPLTFVTAYQDQVCTHPRGR